MKHAKTDWQEGKALLTFRAPLYHRLAGDYTLRLPTLAEHRADLGRLLAHFLAATAQYSPGTSPPG